MTTFICSHGFGVGANSRGMFTDIAAAFPEHTFVTFDYNEVDAAGNMTVKPFSDQVKILNQKLDEQTEKVTLLCHSQGCIVAAMANLENVERLIFITPPQMVSIERMLDVFGSRPGSHQDDEGAWHFPRRDGTETTVPAEYFKALATVKPIELFATATKQCPVTIIKAQDDEILGPTSFDELTDAKIITIPGGHDFTGEYRQGLIDSLL